MWNLRDLHTHKTRKKETHTQQQTDSFLHFVQWAVEHHQKHHRFLRWMENSGATYITNFDGRFAKAKYVFQPWLIFWIIEMFLWNLIQNKDIIMEMKHSFLKHHNIQWSPNCTCKNSFVIAGSKQHFLHHCPTVFILKSLQVVVAKNKEPENKTENGF